MSRHRFGKHLVVLVVSTMVAVGLPTAAWAADGEWTGAGNLNWNTAANWVGNTIAGNWDNVLFGNNVVNGTVNNDIVQGHNNVTVASGCTQNIVINGSSRFPIVAGATITVTGAGGWADVTLNQEISAAHIVAGRLRFKPAANAYGAPYATFQFKVSDGTAYSAAATTMTVNVTQLLDDPPVVMVAAEATVNQTAVGVVKARSDGSPVFSITGGDDAGLFGIANVADTGVLSFLAAPTVIGAKYYVEVTVTDPRGSAKVLIEVTVISGSPSGTIFTFRLGLDPARRLAALTRPLGRLEGTQRLKNI